MRFLCGDMSEGPKHVKAKTSHTAFVQIPPFTLLSNISENRMTTCGICEVRLLKTKSANFLPTAAKNAGLQGRVTNHSVRKTCISRLLDEDVPDNFVAQLSGHRSLKSLNAYKSASHERQRRMSLALSRSGSNQLASISTHTETTTRPITSVTSVESATFNPVQMGSGFFSGATIESFNNCTFNIRLTSGQLCTTEPSDSSSKRPRIGKATTR